MRPPLAEIGVVMAAAIVPVQLPPHLPLESAEMARRASRETRSRRISLSLRDGFQPLLHLVKLLLQDIDVCR